MKIGKLQQLLDHIPCHLDISLTMWFPPPKPAQPQWHRRKLQYAQTDQHFRAEAVGDIEQWARDNKDELTQKASGGDSGEIWEAFNDGLHEQFIKHFQKDGDTPKKLLDKC